MTSLGVLFYDMQSRMTWRATLSTERAEIVIKCVCGPAGIWILTKRLNGLAYTVILSDERVRIVIKNKRKGA